MKRKCCALLTMLAFIITLLPTSAVFAAPPPATATDDAMVNVIVVLEDKPLLARETAQSMGAKAYLETDAAQSADQRLRQQQKKVLQQIAALDTTPATGRSAKAVPSLTPKFTYTHVLNGFCVTVPRHQLEAIKALPGVKTAAEDTGTPLPKEPAPTSTASPSGSPSSSLTDMRADVLQAQGIKGQGTVIAVIDSELQDNHAFFSGEVAQPRLTKDALAKAVQQDSLNIDAGLPIDSLYRSSKLPFAYNYFEETCDTYSTNEDTIHGSHVSGIACGRNGTLPNGERFDGVAPEAQLVFMGVAEKETGYIYDSAALAALEDAARLHVDAINMSFGSDYALNIFNSYSQSIQYLRQSGIFVAAACGNSGLNRSLGKLSPEAIDYSTVGIPNSDPYSFAVASSDASGYWTKPLAMDVEGQDQKIYYARFNDMPIDDDLTTSYHDYVYCGQGLPQNYKDKDVRGKIALIDRGYSYDITMPAALKAGARALIIINFDNSISPNNIKNVLPVLVVGHSDGEKMKQKAYRLRLSSETPESQLVGNTLNPSAFSSWGVPYDLDLKPEITAPGGNIYSSYPGKTPQESAYETMSGTSMASPNLAGASLLLRQYINSHPEQYPNINLQAPFNRFMENLMMSTATVLNDPQGDAPASPRQQGAGLVNLEAATTTPVVLLNDQNQSKLVLGESIDEASRSFTLTFDAYNFSDQPVTYQNVEVSVIGDSLNEKGRIGAMQHLKTAQIDKPSSITVPAGERMPISITVTLDAATVAAQEKAFPNGFYVDGFVRLYSNKQQLPSVGLPFTGFYGDWCKAPSLDQPYFSGKSVLEGNRLYSEDANDLENPHYLGDDSFLSLFDPEGTYPTHESEDYCAISPNGDGYHDILGLQMSNLRAFYIHEINVCDEKGVYFQTTLSGRENPKNLPIFFRDLLPTLPEGNYTVNVICSNLYHHDTAPKETISMDFSIDNKAPVVDTWSLSSNGKRLSFHANDNHALMGVVISGTRLEDGQQDTLVLTTDQCDDIRDHVFSADVSAFAPASLTATVYDFALNRTTLCGENGSVFVDVHDSDWFADAVDYVYQKQLMVGTSDGHFSPQGTTTRAQFITTLWRMAGSPEYEDTRFEDVPTDAYYSNAVNWAVGKSITSGTSKNTFSPDAVLSREEMATLLYRYAGLDGKDTLHVDQKALDAYTDVDSVHDWAQAAMCWSVTNQLLKGTTDTTLAPQLDTNRAQLATVLMQYGALDN